MILSDVVFMIKVNQLDTSLNSGVDILLLFVNALSSFKNLRYDQDANDNLSDMMTRPTKSEIMNINNDFTDFTVLENMCQLRLLFCSSVDGLQIWVSEETFDQFYKCLRLLEIAGTFSDYNNSESFFLLFLLFFY